jgi:hypothetical protein
MNSPAVQKLGVLPIWLPHWLTFMFEVSREEIAWRQKARGRKKAGEGRWGMTLSLQVINNSAAVQQERGITRLYV